MHPLQRVASQIKSRIPQSAPRPPLASHSDGSQLREVLKLKLNICVGAVTLFQSNFVGAVSSLQNSPIVCAEVDSHRAVTIPSEARFLSRVCRWDQALTQRVVCRDKDVDRVDLTCQRQERACEPPEHLVLGQFFFSYSISGSKYVRSTQMAHKPLMMLFIPYRFSSETH
jgi:hypothetical protein